MTVDKDGIAHAESVIESHPMAMTIEELKRQRTISRLSREKNEHSPNRITGMIKAIVNLQCVCYSFHAYMVCFL